MQQHEIDSIYLGAAIKLATRFHGSQLDKAGKLYILHPLHVMLQMKTINEQLVAVLHDIIEDTTCSMDQLRYTFPIQVTEAIDAISKRNGETNKEYWTRVKSNKLALAVKLEDIKHNSSEDRMNGLKADEQVYLRDKYKRALEFLTKE